MHPLIVKEAGLFDIEHLVILFDLYRQFYGKESDCAQVRQFIKDRFNHSESTIFIAYLSEVPVGFAQLYPSFSSVSLSRIFILNDLFVVPEARNKGVATHLLEKAKQFSQTLGAIRLTLSTAITNESAQKLYASNGWKKDEQFYVYHFSLPS